METPLLWRPLQMEDVSRSRELEGSWRWYQYLKACIMHEKRIGKRHSSPLTIRLTTVLFTPNMNVQNLTFSIAKYVANPSPVRKFLLAQSQALQISEARHKIGCSIWSNNFIPNRTRIFPEQMYFLTRKAGWGRNFFVFCWAHRGSTVGVVRHARDLQVSVAAPCFCRVLNFVSP